MQSSTGGVVWFALDENGVPEGITVSEPTEDDWMGCPQCGEPWFATAVLFTPDGVMAAHSPNISCLNCGIIISVY